MTSTRRQPTGEPVVLVGKNSLGLGHRELNLLSDLLDRAQGKSAGQPNRVFARWPFRHTHVKVSLQHPGGNTVLLTMASRNVSRGGISLLHNTYVHQGSRCTVMLPVPDGPAAETPAVVTFCQHRHARLHELGVRFDHPINIRKHVNTAAGSDVFVFENIQPGSLQGRLLVVDDQPAEQLVITRHLRETRLAIRCVSTAAEAIAVPAGSFDLLLLDWNLGDTTGSEVLTQLRAAGCGAAVCFMTEDPAGLLRDKRWNPSSAGVLCKPFTAIRLMQTLAEMLDEGAKAGAPDAAEVDLETASRLQAECAAMEARLRANDVAGSLDHCLAIGSIAASARLNNVTTAVDSAIAAIAGGQSSASEKIRDLLRSCSSWLPARAA